MSTEEEAMPEKESGVVRTLVNVLVIIVAVFVLQWGMRTFLFGAYNVPSGSMENTIKVGDMIFSEKVSYYFTQPKQGDIVTFEDPENAGRTLVKRVVAVGGQTVDLQNGKVVVDGVVQDEDYTNGKQSVPLKSSITYPYTVPEGYLWVMGDNRTNSQDSRYFGAVKASTVTGRACLCYWPLEDFGPL